VSIPLGLDEAASAIGEIVRRRAEEIGLEGDFGRCSLGSGSGYLGGSRRPRRSQYYAAPVLAQRAGGRCIRAGQRWDDSAAAL
jgi:hypothetical protein